VVLEGMQRLRDGAGVRLPEPPAAGARSARPAQGA
jgi:hypothetical protein